MRDVLRIVRGWAIAAMGDAEDGATELREALAAVHAGDRDLIFGAYDLGLLADTRLMAGRASQAMAQIDEPSPRRSAPGSTGASPSCTASGPPC